MFRIVFYNDGHGNEPVLDFIRRLKAGTNKNSRINAEKVDDYIEILSRCGKAAGYPFVKHIEDEIWELRPLRNRIFFAGYMGNCFVLLHQFLKKTRKTPRNEIEKAKRELEDFKRRNGNG